MSNLNANPNPAANYGITEKKKTELDKLTLEVADAQYDVDQLQAIVTSLIAKWQQFQTMLTVAEADKIRTSTNCKMLDDILKNVANLSQNTSIALDETSAAFAKTKTDAAGVKVLIDKLIFSASAINKLSTMLIRQKALNPLISDELVSMVAIAGKDANNAVTLTLVALQSTLASQMAATGADAAAGLTASQSNLLYDTLTNNQTGLKQQLDHAYAQSLENYEHINKANTNVMLQLNHATENFASAQIKLRSLQAGLAAGNAAALAL